MRKPKMPVRKWSSGRGALILIALLFGSSAIVRLGAGTGQAIAKEMAEMRPAASMGEAGLMGDRSAEIDAILAALENRQQQLDDRERQLQELEQSLAFAEKQIRENMDALVRAEQELSATIAQSESAAETDLARLTSVYENMKPQQAATLFQEMTPEFAAGFVGRMRPDAAAQILAGLTPQAAYTISVILAGRNALAPTE